MIYQATEEDMCKYSQIVQQLSALEVQRSNLLRMIKEWENAHVVEENAHLVEEASDEEQS